MANVICFGSLNMDLVCQLHHLPRVGETIAADQIAWLPGGKGANQAVAAARMGANVTMVGRVGSDAFGRQMLQVLQAEGIETSAIAVDPAVGTGLAAVMVDGTGRNMIVTGCLANGRFCETDLDRAEPLLAAAQVAVLQMEMPRELGESIIRRAARAGVRVVFNQAPANPISPEVRPLVDLLVVNEVEAESLSGLAVTDPESAAAAALQLNATGPRAVVVTLGGAGVVCYEGGAKPVHLPAPRVRPVDTTAAGDTFVGALSVALAAGRGLTEAVAQAQFAAALSTTRTGAIPSIPTLAEVLAFRAGQGQAES